MNSREQMEHRRQSAGSFLDSLQAYENKRINSMLNHQAINCDARLYMNDMDNSQKLFGTSGSYRMPIQAPTTFGSDAQNISMYGQTIGSAPPQSTDLNKPVSATIDPRMLKRENRPWSRFSNFK